MRTTAQPVLIRIAGVGVVGRAGMPTGKSANDQQMVLQQDARQQESANDQQEVNKQEANQQELTHEDYLLRSAVDAQVRMVCADIHATRGRGAET